MGNRQKQKGLQINLTSRYDRGCAHTANSANDEWFSLELEEEKRVAKVQIARRMDNCGDCSAQGQNIRISIGPSQSYDPSEPLCLPEINELQRNEGLQDYICTGDLHLGKFVKISKVGWIALCEVKIFTLPVTFCKFCGRFSYML